VRPLTPKIHAEIGAVLETALKTRNLVRVYAEAEQIRQANLKDNVALEDIVSEIMRLSVHGLGFEANPADARDALLGIGSPADTINGEATSGLLAATLGK
jgi:hypothetical protein